MNHSEENASNPSEISRHLFEPIFIYVSERSDV